MRMMMSIVPSTLSSALPNPRLVVREVFRFSDSLQGGRCFLSRQESRQQELQPSKQEMEVITGGGQHGVNGIAGMVCKIIAAHAVLGLEMTDHWFGGGAPPQLAFDLRREPALHPLRINPQPIIRRRIVA